MLYFEDNDDPWNLFSKYLDTASYAGCSYKSRNYYENILISTGTCEISHFSSSADKKVYNFSKVIFKRIISVEEWGLSTLREREFLHPEQKISIKYNFWDYIGSFYKAFLYENLKKNILGFSKFVTKFINKSCQIGLHNGGHLMVQVFKFSVNRSNLYMLNGFM